MKKRRTKAEIEAGLTLEEALIVRQLKEGEEKVETIGLGDVVDKITTITGIKAVARMLNGGEDCEACEERKRRWNKLFGAKHPLPMTVKEYEWLKEYIPTTEGRGIYGKSNQMKLQEIEERLWQFKYNGSHSCPDCVRSTFHRVKKVYDSYND